MNHYVDSSKRGRSRGSKLLEGAFWAAALTVCYKLGPDAIDYWQEKLDAYFSSSPFTVTHQTESLGHDAENFSKQVIVKEEKEKFPPLPEPTTEQLVKGFENVKCALEKGGASMLRLVHKTAGQAGLDPEEYCALMITESALRNVGNEFTTAENVSQNTEANRIDNTARHGKKCLKDIEENDKKAAALLRRISPYIYLSEGDKGAIVLDEKGYNNLCETERQAVFRKHPLPVLKAKASAKERKAHETACKKAQNLRLKALEPYAAVHKELKQLVFDLNNSSYVALRLSAEDLALKLGKLKALIAEKNPEGRAAQLLAKFGDGFLYKVIHNGGYSNAIRACLVRYDTPLLDVLTGPEKPDAPGMSAEAKAAKVQARLAKIEKAKQTMANNKWPKGMTAGQFLDSKALQMFCERNGYNVYNDPASFQAYLREADKIFQTKRAVKGSQNASLIQSGAPEASLAPTEKLPNERAVVASTQTPKINSASEKTAQKPPKAPTPAELRAAAEVSTQKIPKANVKRSPPNNMIFYKSRRLDLVKN